MSSIKNIIIDSDTFNEVDDQFAIVYALLNKDYVRVKAFYAAPFLNKNAVSAKEGMYKSYNEIQRLLRLLGEENKYEIYLGAEDFLKDEKTYVYNRAAEHLVEFVENAQERVYVIAIAALTNIASAILLKPAIADKMTVIWLGGHDYTQKLNNEFNLRQDIHAARIVFNYVSDLIHIPCRGVVTDLVLTLAELEKYAEHKSPIGTYLTSLFRGCKNSNFSYSRVVSDLAATACVIHPEMMDIIDCTRPCFKDDLSYTFTLDSKPLRKVQSLDRNKIVGDLLYKLYTIK